MTIDEKKSMLNEYLSKNGRLKRLYAMKEQMIDTKKNNFEYYTAVKMDIQLVKTEKEIERLIPKVNASKEKIIAEIDSIKISDSKDELYKDILKLRYIADMKWEDISDKLCYCYVYVLSLHREALRYIFN